MEKITHKEVVGMTIRYLRERGWQPASGFRGRISPPDIKFQKGIETIFGEVKPSYAKTEEILKGIGQCTTYLLGDMWVKPYLIISEEAAKHFSDIIWLPELYWLGVISYTRDKMRVFKKSERTPIPQSHLDAGIEIKRVVNQAKWSVERRRREPTLPDF